MRTIAHVQRDYGRDGIAIWLARFGDETTEVMVPVTPEFRREPREEAAAYTDPSIRLPEDMARALLDALLAHYGGSAEVQTLRRDYDAERARVDQLLGHLAYLAGKVIDRPESR